MSTEQATFLPFRVALQRTFTRGAAVTWATNRVVRLEWVAAQPVPPSAKNNAT